VRRARAYTGAVKFPWFSGVALVSLLLSACGGDDTKPSSREGDVELGADTDKPSCQDADGDGYGPHCEAGDDCDDADDTVFEECGVCSDVREGCLCDAAAVPIDCKVPLDKIEGDPLLCKVGKRYCRDGVWSDCIGVVQYAD
jgi:hypothetical protein